MTCYTAITESRTDMLYIYWLCNYNLEVLVFYFSIFIFFPLVHMFYVLASSAILVSFSEWIEILKLTCRKRWMPLVLYRTWCSDAFQPEMSQIAPATREKMDNWRPDFFFSLSLSYCIFHNYLIFTLCLCHMFKFFFPLSYSLCKVMVM